MKYCTQIVRLDIKQNNIAFISLSVYKHNNDQLKLSLSSFNRTYVCNNNNNKKNYIILREGNNRNNNNYKCVYHNYYYYSQLKKKIQESI